MNWFKKLSWVPPWDDIPDDQFVARLGPRWSNPSPGKFVTTLPSGQVTVTKRAPLKESNEPDSEMAIFKSLHPDKDPSTEHLGEVIKIASWVDRNCRIAWYHAEKALEQAHEDWMGEEESSRKPPVQRRQPPQNTPPWDYKHIMALSLADGDEALATKIEVFDDASLNFLRDIISARFDGDQSAGVRDRVMLALSNGKINPSNRPPMTIAPR